MRTPDFSIHQSSFKNCPGGLGAVLVTLKHVVKVEIRTRQHGLRIRARAIAALIHRRRRDRLCRRAIEREHRPAPTAAETCPVNAAAASAAAASAAASSAAASAADVYRCHVQSRRQRRRYVSPRAKRLLHTRRLAGGLIYFRAGRTTHPPARRHVHTISTPCYRRALLDRWRLLCFLLCCRRLQWAEACACPTGKGQ